MKYIKTYQNHKSVNEEFLGLGKLFGNLFKKIKQNIAKTKGGKEIEAIYQKYLTTIQQELSKQAQVDLNILAASQLKESVKIYEAEEVEAEENTGTEETDKNTKTSLDKLKTKSAIIDQIVKKYKELALKEMDNVLKKFGGAEKNPKLSLIIQAKKDQFELDFLNAKIEYLEKAGDKTQVDGIKKQRDAVSKKVQEDWKKFEQGSLNDNVEYKSGDTVKYKMDNGEEGEKKIERIEGDNFYFMGEDGKMFQKTRSQIISKVNSQQTEETSKDIEDLKRTLGTLKTDTSSIKKINNISKLFQDKEANKEKISEIEKIIGPM